MAEYESTRKHFSTKDRWIFIGLFVFWMIPLIGSHMAFGGYDIWLTRILTWIAGAFALLVLVSFVDARRMAAERRRRRQTGETIVQLGTKNWFWANDDSPADGA